MAQAVSPRRRVAVACQMAKSFAVTLPDERADALAQRIVQAVREEAGVDDDAE
jgi:hypothetical protein